MAELKAAPHRTESEEVIDRAKNFWNRSGKTIAAVLGGIILVVAGILIYKNMIKAPKEREAADAIFKAESYFQADSLDKALNGDGQYLGFEKLASKYSGTASGNLAKFYAGSIYLRKGAFDKAVSYLKDFSTDAPQIQARASKLLGDAYGEQGKAKDAVDAYKKAATEFKDDEAGASEALFMAAYASDKLLNDKSGATELYKKVKADYSRTQWSYEADKYLAALGVYNAD